MGLAAIPAFLIEVGMPTIQHPPPVISGDAALRIAHTDASIAYGDLSLFRISLSLETDGWHIDYDLKDRRLKGGGPHYILDAITGAILSKRYDQ
jgi:hypothetical protein